MKRDRKPCLALHYQETGSWRVCAVVRAGRKWTRLLDIGTLHAYKVANSGFTPLPEHKPRRLARQLDAKRRQWNRLKIGYRTEGDVKAVVAALRAMP